MLCVLEYAAAKSVPGLCFLVLTGKPDSYASNVMKPRQSLNLPVRSYTVCCNGKMKMNLISCGQLWIVINEYVFESVACDVFSFSAEVNMLEHERVYVISFSASLLDEGLRCNHLHLVCAAMAHLICLLVCACFSPAVLENESEHLHKYAQNLKLQFMTINK